MFTRHVNVKNNNSGYDVKVGRGLFENIGVEISNLNFKSHVLTPDGLIIISRRHGGLIPPLLSWLIQV